MLVKEGQLVQEYARVYSLVERPIGIPIFQRFYDWKTKQTDALLEDILAAIEDRDKQIYLLDFIYFIEEGRFKLADGQQRVVTINLLIKAINDHIQNSGLSISPMKGFDIVYDIPQHDRKYQCCMDDYPVAPFKKNYLYFANWIQEHEAELPEIIQIIKERIFVFIKKTDSVDDAFTIFQQINTGGKPLTKDEVISSTIQQFSEIYGIAINCTKKDLKKIILSYYKFLHATVADDFDAISIMSFLRREIVVTKEAFQKFAQTVDTIVGLTNNPMTALIGYLNRPQLIEILNILGMQRIDVFRKREYLDYVMFPLCLLSISMTLRKANPGGIIRTLYTKIINSIKENKSAIELGEIISTFINSNPEICKIAFEDFENGLGSQETKLGIKKAILCMDVIMHHASSTINIAAVDLEHVYPRKPAPRWSTEGWPTNDIERAEFSENIGNMFLLNGQVNRRIKNAYIEDKVIEYNRIIPMDQGLLTEMNKVDFEAFRTQKRDYIVNRQKRIAQLVFENFKLATVIIVRRSV